LTARDLDGNTERNLPEKNDDQNPNYSPPNKILNQHAAQS